MSSQLKVNSISDAAGANGNAITLATDGTCTAKITNRSNHNLLINGGMNISQRYSSSTSHPAYGADRWRWGFGNHSAGTVTASQQSLSSSDSGPWEKGFRNYTRLALGQAGTAAANTYISMRYKVEAQDITNSGWNYTSASSNITISFWFRCSTNQTFYFGVKSEDGTAQSYVFSFTASGNNTWTKVTKTIPGNSSIQIDNNNGAGLSLWLYQFYGTDETNNKTLNQWSAHSASNLMPDMASTWLTAGASTWDLTGVQLEVGDHATDFEHRSYADELLRCQRYCQKITKGDDIHYFGAGYYYNSTNIYMQFRFSPQMRTTPSLEQTTGGDYYTFYRDGAGDSFDGFSGFQWNNGAENVGVSGAFYVNSGVSGTAGQAGGFFAGNNACKILLSAEL